VTSWITINHSSRGPIRGFSSVNYAHTSVCLRFSDSVWNRKPNSTFYS